MEALLFPEARYTLVRRIDAHRVGLGKVLPRSGQNIAKELGPCSLAAGKPSEGDGEVEGAHRHPVLQERQPCVTVL